MRRHAERDLRRLRRLSAIDLRPVHGQTALDERVIGLWRDGQCNGFAVHGFCLIRRDGTADERGVHGDLTDDGADGRRHFHVARRHRELRPLDRLTVDRDALALIARSGDKIDVEDIALGGALDLFAFARHIERPVFHRLPGDIVVQTFIVPAVFRTAPREKQDET